MFRVGGQRVSPCVFVFRVGGQRVSLCVFPFYRTYYNEHNFNSTSISTSIFELKAPRGAGDDASRAPLGAPPNVSPSAPRGVALMRHRAQGKTVCLQVRMPCLVGKICRAFPGLLMLGLMPFCLTILRWSCVPVTRGRSAVLRMLARSLYLFPYSWLPSCIK